MMDRLTPYRDIARDLNVDAVALVPGPNFTRLTGANFHGNERPLLLIIPAEGAPAAIVPNLELASFGDVGFDGAVFDWRDQTGYDTAFDALHEAMPLGSLAVEGQIMRVFVHHALTRANPALRIIDADAAIARPRLIKSDAEVAALEGAIAISERALVQVLQTVRVGQSEKHIQRLLVQTLLAQGADAMAFGPIVAAGTNAAQPHATSRDDYAIRDGDALLIDFGAVSGGFNADITRTFFVGHADDTARAMYDTVLQANLAGHTATVPGATAHDVDDAVTTVLEASPFAPHIRHKTGHGLGRQVHEPPYIMRGNHTVLEPGMVFTNEPGLYDETRLGIRIEDDILVTADGCRSLTSFPKDLMVLG